MSSSRAIEREIDGLHRFFEEWFTGRLAQTWEVYARFADVTAPEFHLISPTAAMINRDQALTWVWNIHAERPESRIWVENVQLTAVRGELYVATYEEWQEGPDGRTVRLSTALLEEDDAKRPNGLRWLHVHETWKDIETTS